MPNVAQIYTILNAVGAQSLGEAAVSVVDTRSMIALGKSVLASNTNKDAFVGVLMDRIGRTIVSNRVYNIENDPLIKKPFDFGCVLQKLYVDLADANPNNEWNIGDSGYTPSFAPVYKPAIEQRLFDKISTWEYDWTVPDNILKTAFISEENMSAFFAAQMTAMDASLVKALEDAGNLVRATAIAHNISTGTATKIDVLGEFIERNPGTTIASKKEALENEDFLRYAAKRISDVAKYLRRMSRVWNLDGFARHTDADYTVVTLLQEFESAETMTLQSNTFHDELVRLPGYNVVPYWMGSGTAFDFDDTSKVDITIDVSGTATEISQDGVLAVIHDVETLGTTLYEIEASTERNNKDRYTDFFNHANIGYFYDPSENFVVFYMGDLT